MGDNERRKVRSKPVYVNGRNPQPPQTDVRALVDRLLDPERSTLRITKTISVYGKSGRIEKEISGYDKPE